MVVGGAIFVGHGGDLAGEAVTERVHAGALSALFRLWSRGQKGVAAVGFELFFGNHVEYLVACCRFLSTMRGGEIAVRLGRERGWDRRWGVAGIGDAGISEYFRGCERKLDSERVEESRGGLVFRPLALKCAAIYVQKPGPNRRVAGRMNAGSSWHNGGRTKALSTDRSMDIHDYLIDQNGKDWSDFCLAGWLLFLRHLQHGWLTALAMCSRFFEDGSVHMLDVGTGVIQRLADSQDDFATRIDVGDNASNWLMIPLVDQCVEAGLTISQDQCYG